MTLNDIKNNQELINAYNKMLEAQDALNNIPIQHAAEVNQLKLNLKNQIEILMANPHYTERASTTEKTKIQTLLDSLS